MGIGLVEQVRLCVKQEKVTGQVSKNLFDNGLVIPNNRLVDHSALRILLQRLEEYIFYDYLCFTGLLLLTSVRMTRFQFSHENGIPIVL